MKNLLMAGTALLCLISGSAAAMDEELAELNQTLFESVDVNEDGRVSQREIELYRLLVLASMDADGDGIILRDEYMNWDLGFEDLAKQQDRLNEYWKVREDVFNAWDSDQDGILSPAEQSVYQIVDFYEASGHTNRPLNLAQFSTGLRIVAAMNSALSNNEPLVLINPFEVPADKLEETIAMWEQARDFLQQQPGYISTALHQSVKPDARFQLINVAKWNSADAFMAATKKMWAEAGLPKIEGVVPNPALFTVIRRE